MSIKKLYFIKKVVTSNREITDMYETGSGEMNYFYDVVRDVDWYFMGFRILHYNNVFTWSGKKTAEDFEDGGKSGRIGFGPNSPEH